VTPDDAAWVRQVVWQRHHRQTDAEVPGFYARCACQYGGCGHCGAGRHHACTHEQHHAAEHCAGYLTGRSGYVLAQVWETGHRRTWICACKRDDHGQAARQLSLF
jgi:hypothetical protein